VSTKEQVERGELVLIWVHPHSPAGCKAHIALVKLTGSWKKAPQLDPDAKRRELY